MCLEHQNLFDRVVRQIDWVDNVWPRHFKEDQDEGTNALNKMKYPKVGRKVTVVVNGEL